MFDFLYPKVPQVQAEDLKKAIDTHEDFFLLDVRTAGEYAKGKIAKSINLPVDEVPTKVERLIPDKSKKIYVYCLSGSRSVFAVDAMKKMGYSNVFDIKSGLLAWRAKGFLVG
ncbi:MAG TPA: rhodanese-like domain-containing protein [Patescibacteria group bacterium]